MRFPFGNERERFNRDHEEPHLDGNNICELAWKELLIIFNTAKDKEENISARDLNSITHWVSLMIDKFYPQSGWHIEEKPIHLRSCGLWLGNATHLRRNLYISIIGEISVQPLLII